jgi:hypothetical protein
LVDIEVSVVQIRSFAPAAAPIRRDRFVLARSIAATASAHLAKLVDGGLLTVGKKGRNRGRERSLNR